MGAYVKKNCAACGDIIEVRLADHKRGWGRFCHRQCAAVYKRGKRPRDVNARYAKIHPWAATCMEIRGKYYDGEAPPKAPSIKDQIGSNPKIKKGVRQYPVTEEQGHEEAMRATEEGWDGHKVWTS